MVDKKEEVDILHPLTTLQWEECKVLPEGIDDTRCVLFNGKLYVSGRLLSSGHYAKLFRSSSDLKSWTTLTTPCYWFALTTYLSQIVLIGGIEVATKEMTKKLWTSDNGSKWRTSLPQMLTARSGTSAISVGNPECLVVAGGEKQDHVPSTIVDVLIEDQWHVLQSLPKRCYDIKFSCHRGVLHVMGGYGQDTAFMYWCNVSTIQQIPQNKDAGRKFPLWNRFNLPLPCSCLTSFGQQLLVFGILIGLECTKIYAHVSGKKSWVLVGNMPIELRNVFSIKLSTQQFVVIGVDEDSQKRRKRKVFKGTLKGSSYNLMNKFEMSSLARLEGLAKIDIVTTLTEKHKELMSAAGITLDAETDEKLQSIADPNVYIEIIIDEWIAKCGQHPPTWSSLIKVLRVMDLEDMCIDIEDYMYGKLKYLEAYRKVLDTHDCIDMWFIKVIFLGASRMGKTAACRRLSGVMKDITSSGKTSVPSTGVVEMGQNVIIKHLASNSAHIMPPTEWAVSEDLDHEACTLLQFLYGQTQKAKQSEYLEVAGANVSTLRSSSEEVRNVNATVKHSTVRRRNVVKAMKNAEAAVNLLGADARENIEVNNYYNNIPSIQSEVVESESYAIPSQSISKTLMSSSSLFNVTERLVPTPSKKDDTSMTVMFRRAMNSRHWQEVKSLLEEMVVLKIEDTGGQPEFMDMLPAFTIGPALYLLFCKLTDNLHSYYTETYLSSTGVSTVPEQSTYTVQEVLLRALASISCFNASPSNSEFFDAETCNDIDTTEPFNKSIAYIVGTHKDVVSEQQIDRFDRQLQECVQSTDFSRQNLVQYASDERMVLPIDNMHGGEDEMKMVRKLLEDGIKQHFKKLSIPASWLILSLCLRKRKERTASLDSVLKIAKGLSISFAETKLALWFLHHYAGSLMFFPNVPELKHIVICDIQVIYDSVTRLIVNTFKLGSVSKKASTQFRETGQFSLEDIREATASISGDYIPLQKLIRLLEHLNVISLIKTGTYSRSASYFMPCILQNATAEECDLWWDDLTLRHSPAPLLVHYKCGYVPIGIFPAMVANLAGRKSLELVVEDIRKNIVQFRYGSDNDVITLFSQPRFYAVHLTRSQRAQVPTHVVCRKVRDLVESGLRTVTSRMNYSFFIEHQLAFECPSHPARDHVCVVEECEDSDPVTMCCTDVSAPHRVEMEDRHLVWFNKPFCCIGSDHEGDFARNWYLLLHTISARSGVVASVLLLLGAILIAIILIW